jgi:cytoskeletal protein CcmA (bactofilin family)
MVDGFMDADTAETQTGEKLWTAELIAGLDWRRLVEISRAMAAFAGFELGKTRVPPSAAAEYLMKMQRPDGTKQRSLFRVAPWNRWMAGADCIRDLIAAASKEVPRANGIYLAPGGFTESALLTAQQNQIEAVDAPTLAQRLNELPAEHSKFFFENGTAGDARSPSCPLCLQPLKLTAGPVMASEFDHLPDLTFKGHVIIGDPIRARRLEVQAHSEVEFLHEVRARDVVVDGIARGDFHCYGSVKLNPGAVLYGSVSARSVIVSDGAELAGETRILENLPQTTVHKPYGSLWLCDNPAGKPGCSAIAFSPHD